VLDLYSHLEAKAKLYKYDCKKLTRKERKAENGYYSETDVIFKEIKLKLIDRKRVAIKPSPKVDALLIRENGDNNQIFIMIPLSDYLGMIANGKRG
jgi:hypothetical protein